MVLDFVPPALILHRDDTASHGPRLHSRRRAGTQTSADALSWDRENSDNAQCVHRIELFEEDQYWQSIIMKIFL